MENVINIKYPKSLADQLDLNEQEFEKEFKTSAIIKLFEMGKISSGTAAKMLGVSRLDFLDLLSDYQVSPFSAYTIKDLNEDIKNA